VAERESRLIRKWMMSVGLLLLPFASAQAQWTGKGEAGLAIASGNSESQSGNAKLAVAHKMDSWENSAGLAGNYVSDDVGTTAQRFEVFGQSRHQYSTRTYWHGGLRYEDDRFSGFNYQATFSTGLGRQFIENDRTKFSGQIGVGYKYFETRDSIDPDTLLPTPGDRDSSVALVGGSEFTHEFNDSTTFFDKFGFESTTDNLFLQNEIGIAVKMTGRLALAVAFAIRHNTDPPPAFRKTDTLTTVNLVYEVK
jgi:putative salt-induced outer membrane protein